MMKKLVLVLAVITSTVFKGHAQLAVGGDLSYNQYFAGVGGLMGLGVLGDYGIRDGKYSVRGSYNYILSKDYKGTTEATSLNSWTTPQYINVNYTSKLKVMNLNVDFKKYFGDGEFSEGGFYGALGAGLTFASVATTYGSYDKTNYTVSDGGSQGESYSQWMIRGAIGYEKVFDWGGIFGEALLSVPATHVNGSAVEINIPASASLVVGYKFLFGGK
jgi:hypothetical protein